MKQFEVGKTYKTRLAGDHNLEVTAEILGRTPSTVIALIDGETKGRFKISLDRFSTEEMIRPFGRYSMAPIISA
ncbi:hypothetical protein LQZ19_08800 [Treponema primitia]|uniref:hypothetical protein n=1 Tax=Treponema primitia TaxID=88058 RepID=UPI003980FF63